MALIDNFEAEAIARIEADLKQVQLALDSNASQIVPLEEKLAALRDELKTLPGVEAKLKKFAPADGDDLQEVDRAHERKARRDREQRAVDADAEILQRAGHGLTELVGQISQVRVLVDVPREITLSTACRLLVSAMANVVRNAIESYAHPTAGLRPGTVWIEARAQGHDAVAIAVKDQGTGIDRETLEALRQFAPGRISKRHYGTGCGLPIARRNVLAHHGELRIESRPGQGTVVTIVLPVSPAKGEAP